MWKVVSKPFHNAHRIFPTKQKDVYEMVQVCRKDSNIKRMVVFGSSVTNACNPWSDIDVYFVMEKEPKNYPTTGSPTAVFDKWTNFSISRELADEINKTGVIVYYEGELEDEE